MDRHAVGDRRPPGRIGAGVEIAGEVERGQPAVGVAADASPASAPDGAWCVDMHRLGPRVDQAHRPAELPGGDRRAAAAPRGRACRRSRRRSPSARCAPARARCRARARSRRGPCRASACRRRSDRERGRRRRSLGPAGLRLDVGVLDEARSRSVPSADCAASAERRVDVAAHDAAAAPACCRASARAAAARRRRAAPRRCRASCGSGVPARSATRRRAIASHGVARRRPGRAPPRRGSARRRRRSTGWSLQVGDRCRSALLPARRRR